MESEGDVELPERMRKHGLPRHACLTINREGLPINRGGDLVQERVRRRGPRELQSMFLIDLLWARNRYLVKQGYPRTTVLKPSTVSILFKQLQFLFESEPHTQTASQAQLMEHKEKPPRRTRPKAKAATAAKAPPRARARPARVPTQPTADCEA